MQHTVAVFNSVLLRFSFWFYYLWILYFLFMVPLFIFALHALLNFLSCRRASWPFVVLCSFGQAAGKHFLYGCSSSSSWRTCPPATPTAQRVRWLAQKRNNCIYAIYKKRNGKKFKLKMFYAWENHNKARKCHFLYTKRILWNWNCGIFHTHTHTCIHTHTQSHTLTESSQRAAMQRLA